MTRLLVVKAMIFPIQFANYKYYDSELPKVSYQIHNGTINQTGMDANKTLQASSPPTSSH